MGIDLPVQNMENNKNVNKGEEDGAGNEVLETNDMDTDGGIEDESNQVENDPDESIMEVGEGKETEDENNEGNGSLEENSQVKGTTEENSEATGTPEENSEAKATPEENNKAKDTPEETNEDKEVNKNSCDDPDTQHHNGVLDENSLIDEITEEKFDLSELEGNKDNSNDVDMIGMSDSGVRETSGEANSATSKTSINNHNDEFCGVVPPEGWKRKIIGSSSGTVPKKLVCYTSPTGENMYTANELRKYCDQNNLKIDMGQFIFSIEVSASERSNTASPATRNADCASPSNSMMSNDMNSDSQNSSEATSVSSSKDKKLVSTSALLRAYRPHSKSSPSKGQGNSEKGQSSSEKNSNQKVPAEDQSTPDIVEDSAPSANTRRYSSRRKPVVNNENEAPTNSSDSSSTLLMECKTESLSSAQLNKVSQLQSDISRLQLMLWNGGQVDKNGGSMLPMMNGTQPLTNGAGLVGLQVPQFLLLQNGQMIGSSIQQTSPASNTPSTSQRPKRSTAGKSAAEAARQRAARNKNTNTGRSSPDIEVVKEMRQPTHVQNTSSTTTSSPAVPPNQKGFPLLNIMCRPKNTIPPSMAMAQRKELDGKVKSVLVKTAQEFVEWLLSEGMIRTFQYCSLHKVQPSQAPFKLKLGMFSDPKVLATSGGYVWISECCGKKYVSVYSGSIFGSTPIDKVAPTAVLKLVYHWACQTSIANVESWVKVEKLFINKIFNYLRCVCSVMLQDKVYDFGFDGTTVELGIVSLGTSTADGTKKAVKVEILGLYDRKMKSYRLFASEPEPGSSSRQRFVRILKPLERVVHTNAILLCDQSVDRNCLYNMHYGKVSVCETSDNEDNLQSNAKVMSYLRRHVPKMFQSTLSQLSLQQVQIVLDELCWRERFGHCAAQAYSTMVEHITYLTSREAENPGVLHLLDFVAQKPHHNWRYKSQHVPKTIPALQPSIIMSTPTTGTINPQVTMDIPTNAQSPLEHKNKVALTPRSRGTAARDLAATTQAPKAIMKTVVPTTALPSTPPNVTAKPDAVELEPFYYGQIQGDSSLGREVNSYSFTCHLCSESFHNNVEFYTHLKGHLGRRTVSQTFCCEYCTEHFDTAESRNYHHKFRHLQMDTRYTWCRICTESFPGEFQLVNHMAKKHYESELPYRCEVCNFTTSIYFSIINHFKVEHKGSPYVQCHYCLCVKTINSSSASSFSTRMMQHLQKHTSQQGKCKSCLLTFYSKFLLDEHKKKDHVSRTNIQGLQKYKVPAGHNKIMFRPWVKKGAQENKKLITLQTSNTVAISVTLERLDALAVNVGDTDQKFYCIECDASLTLDEHFKAYQKCTKCSYSTCCRNMVSKHAQVFHPNGKGKSGYYRIGPSIALPQPLFCICGFSSRSGNHLARHLALCEGGRQSAYPSMLDAMVFRGDQLTPNALALSTLGLSRMLPGSVDPTQSTSTMAEEETPGPAIDMSNFMSMSMDVDEDIDDAPVMPVSVEMGD